MTPARSASALRAILVLTTLLVAPLAAPHAQASTPAEGSVWTVHVTVDADVVDNYATVRVIADIGNRGPDPEFPFVVRVPADAFVSGLTVERDGEVHEATVEEREAARARYDDWKGKERTGALVEARRGTETVAFLVNVAEFESVRATLTYEVPLVAHAGVYSLPLEAPVSGFGQDLGARFDVTVAHTDGVAAAWASPAADVVQEDGVWNLTASVGPRSSDRPTPLNVSYMLAPTPGSGSLAAQEHDNALWFVHRFRAPAEAATLPVDMVLVLDTSGSMDGLKMEQMRMAALQVLRSLDAEDRLHLVFFDSVALTPWAGLRAVNETTRADAEGAIRAATAMGGTNLEAGITRGFAPFADVPATELETRFPVVAVLTDGQPSTGEQDPDALRALARNANDRGATVAALAFGDDAHWGLVHGLAEDAGGIALRVPTGVGAEVDIRRFLEALATPHLRSVTITYDTPGVEVLRESTALLVGSELLIVGRAPAGTAFLNGTVAAVAADGPRAYAFSHAVGDGAGTWVPRLAAHVLVGSLQDRLDAGGAEAELDVWRQALVDLALAHGFVTEHTSLVLTLAARPVDPSSLAGTDPVLDATDRAAYQWATMDLAQDTAPGDGVAGEATTGGDEPRVATPGPAIGLVLMALALVARRRR